MSNINASITADCPIAVFDSGVGGIGPLGLLRRMLPEEDLIYYGDNAQAPYGTKTPRQVLDLVWGVWERLALYRPKLLLIACNTATSAAAPALRASLPIPVVGMEPALKPAHSLRRGGEVLVLATPMTLSLPKFADLMARYGEGAVPVACGGLMEFAERGALDTPELHAHLNRLLAPYQGRPIDAVVLGCTHYVFLRRAIAAHLPPGTPILDGNEGTARRVVSLLEAQGLLRQDGHDGRVTLLTSGDPGRLLPLMETLFEQALQDDI